MQLVIPWSSLRPIKKLNVGGGWLASGKGFVFFLTVLSANG